MALRWQMSSLGPDHAILGLRLNSSMYLQMKVTGERRIRRTDIRSKDSPLRSISNFTDLLRRASNPSPAPR
jgi:hypothetical protein